MSEPLRVSCGTPLVLDSSIAFKWFARAEEGAETAVSLLRRHSRDEVAIVAPAHMPLEIVNALCCRGFPLEDVEEAIRFIVDADLLLAPVDHALLAQAASISISERLALYDAVFIALADRLDAELVTADARQAATRSCRVRVIR